MVELKKVDFGLSKSYPPSPLPILGVGDFRGYVNIVKYKSTIIII